MNPPTLLHLSPRASYLLALGLMACLSVLAFALLQTHLRAQQGSAAVINLSGSQRMLSQRNVLFARELISAPTPQERASLRMTLRSEVDRLERNHARLISDQAPGGAPSSALRRLYFEAPWTLDALVARHVARVNQVLSVPDDNLTAAEPAVQALLNESPVLLLDGLNAAVSTYEAEAEARVATLRRLETLVLAATLVTLVLEGLFIFRPMERELMRRSRQLVHRAFHDDLTGLANRAHLTQQLQLALEPAAGGAPFALLFLDCDRFKVINDSLGHTVGDAVLVALARRLNESVRPDDTVARLGGDEFTVLLRGVADLAAAEQVAARLQTAMAAPLNVDGQSMYVSISIGVVLSDASYTRPEELLRDADLAMYRAKALGRARSATFSPELRERAAALMFLERDLRGAEDRGELSVQYQPVVDLPAGDLRGFEALLRWTHPVHGTVSPGEFIPVAEETGLIVALDRFVLREACRQVQAWQRSWTWAPPLTLSVNVSARHLESPDLAEVVSQALTESGLTPAQLRLELTESILATESSGARATLQRLKALGVGLYIDDFGTGYSNLGYLKRFQADVIKIDRSFVTGMTQSEDSRSLVQTIITLAHSLGMKVVAEGVETDEQRWMLHHLGCESSQGYLFSRPMAPAQVEQYLQAQVEHPRPAQWSASADPRPVETPPS